MQHSKHTGFNLKRKITASLLSLAILGTGTLPLVSTVAANAATEEDAAGAAVQIPVKDSQENKTVTVDGKTENVFWANAKYYDYLSDNEVDGTWRTSITQAGTGHSGSQDDWYPFKKLNQMISSVASGTNWSEPLYFGNFYNGNDGPYATSTHNGGYMSAKNGLTNFKHAPNNSRQGITDHDCTEKDDTAQTEGISEEHKSYQGLVDKTLNAQGDLTVGGGITAPYFNVNDTTKNYVKEFQSSFPFREETHLDYTKYIFRSSTNENKNASDNVYFDWSGNNPTKVNYSYGTSHAVKDGKRYFMWNEDSGYGIYPFNGVGEEKDGKTYRMLYASADSGYPSLNEWTNLKCYFMGVSGQSWPGTQMTWVRDEGNNKVFMIQIPEGATGFVLNNGKDGKWNQTVNGSYDDLKHGAVYVKTDQISDGDDKDKHEIARWPQAPDDAGIQEYKYNTEKLNHGFGVHLTVPFRVPGERLASDGKTVIPAGRSEDGSDITFDFAGDDDLWMFITDITDKDKPCQLVLDMGGNHKKSTGSVNFKTLRSTVNADGEGAVSTFKYDYSHTYRMDVFYMERGMIESNCDMSFTMTPLGNNFIVTEKINTTKVNPGLVDDVTALDEFTFTPSQNGATSWDGGLKYTVDGRTYKEKGVNSVNLASGKAFNVANFFKINDEMLVTQTRSDSVLKYTTDYVFKNNTTGDELDSGHKDSTVETVSTAKGYLSNTGTASGDPYEFAELQADFENTPEVADVQISKETVDFLKDRLATGDKGQDEEFPITVALNFGGSTTGGLYDFAYTKGSESGTADKGKLTIKDGETVTIPNVPVGTTVTVSEDISNSTNFDRKEIKSESFEVKKDGANSSAIKNIRKNPDPVKDKVSVDKTIFTKTFENKSTATLGDGYEFQLLSGSTLVDTKTITDTAKDTGSADFKELTFTVNEADKGKEAQGIFYIDPAEFKNGGSKEFTFTVHENLTDAQKQAIDQPADQEVKITIYYNKAKNTLSTVLADQEGSVPNPVYTTDFTNPYKVGSVSITKTVTRTSGQLDEQDRTTPFTINVSFSFNGKTYPNGVPFYYTVGGNTVYQLGSSQQVTLKHNETARFDGLPVGTIVTVTEESPGPEYSPTVSPDSVKITEEGQALNVSVTNKRQDPDEVTLGVTKKLVNADIAAKAGVTIANAGFEYTIAETTQGAAYFETVKGDSATIEFKPIRFDHAGTRTFRITEKQGNNANIEYDKSKIYVSVTAENDGNKLKITEIKYTDAVGRELTVPSFTNKFKEAQVIFDKAVFDKDLNAASDSTEFSAKVEIKYPQDNDFSVQDFDLPNQDGVIKIRNNGTYTIKKLPIGTQVRITETDARGCLNNYSKGQILTAEEVSATAAAQTTINNQKVQLPVSISAKKAAEGFDLKGDDFTFTLTGAKNGVSQEKKNAASGDVAFDEITYEVRSDNKASSGNNIVIKPDRFVNDVYTEEYTIAETAGNNAFLTYDGTQYKATVTITRTASADAAFNGLYTYTAEVAYTNLKAGDTVPTFTNSWKKAPVSIIKQVLDYDDAAYTTGATFEIDLSFTYPEGYTGTKVENQTVKLNSANGFRTEIKDLPYGTVVKAVESKTQNMKVTYSPENGQVTVGEKANASITVTNKRLEPVNTEFDIQVHKELKYGTLAADQFGFKISGDGFAKDYTVRNDANGLADFGKVKVEYSKTAKDPDTDNRIVYLTDSDFANGPVKLSYTVNEINEKKAGVFYDGSTITCTVEITKDETVAQTTLTASAPVYTKTGATANTDTFVNEMQASVTITKTVRNADGSAITDAQKAKTFKADVQVKLPTSQTFETIAYTYKYKDEGDRDWSVTASTTQLELKHGRTFMLDGIPYGTQVKVTEQRDPNYEPSYNTQIATAGGTAAAVEVTNTLQKPGTRTLGVSKSFDTSALDAGVNLKAKNNKFSFTMTADPNNAVLSGYTSTVVLDKYDNDGKLITTDNFAEIVFPPEYQYGTGVPVKFTVVENSAVEGNDGNIIYDTSKYEVVYTVSQGEKDLVITGPVITRDGEKADAVEFTNKYNTGSAEIKKVVRDADGETLETYKNESFPVTVTIIQPNGSQTEDKKTVSAARSLKYDDLPFGTVVKVEETNAKGMTPTYDPAAKQITVGKDGKKNLVITITNTRKESKGTEFPISYMKELKYDTLRAEQFSFKINGDGFAKDYTVKNDSNGLVDFGKVKVEYSKTAKDPDTENHIVYLTDNQFTDNLATITYTAEEINGGDDTIIYDVSKITCTATVKKVVNTDQTSLEVVSTEYDDGGVAGNTFSNTKTGSVEITKTTKNATGAALDKEFKAQVEFLLPAESGVQNNFVILPFTFEYKDKGDKEWTKDSTTDGTVTLKDGRTIRVSGLFNGTQVKVTEEIDPNYDPSYDPQIATVGGQANVVKVINTLQNPGTKTLSVSKSFTENALNAGINLKAKNNKFSFTMTADPDNAVLKDYTSTVVLDKYDEEGKLVTTDSFKELVFPADYVYGDGTPVKFTVVENSAVEGNDGNIIYDSSKYEVVYTVAQGDKQLDITGPVITKDGAKADAVEFKNDYPVGSVEIKKSVIDFDGEQLKAYADEKFPVTVKITRPDGDETEQKLTVSVSESIKLENLPYGTAVEVQETDAKGMKASIDNAKVTVSAATPAPVVTITNKRTTLNPTDVQVPAVKTIKGADVTMTEYKEAFLFRLTGNGIDLTARNDAQGKVLFDKINFRIKKSAADTAEENTILVDKSAFAKASTIPYTFEVKEIPSNRSDIAFDANTYKVTVNVTMTETLNSISLSAAVDPATVPTFTNQKLGRAILTKIVKDINGEGIKPDADFKFSMAVDGKVVKDDIIINVSKDDTAQFVTGFYPVGTVITFTETDTKGFECAEPVQNVSIVDESGLTPSASVEFVNVHPQPGQTGIVLNAFKTVNGYKLSDGDFSFTAKGKGLDETKKNAANGTISFSKITFKYTKGNEADTGNTVYLREGDFTDGKATLNYEIKEVAGGNTDIIYAENTVKAVVTVTKTETVSDITLSAKAEYPGGNTFNNPVRKGSATIIKKDQGGNAVNGVEFTLFKVDSDKLSRDEVLADGVVVDSKTTSGGTVTFENLDLYVNDSQTLSNPTYQWYCFAETNSGSKHNLNSELTFFRIPTEDVYDVEFTYMNGKITTPTSGGEGMFTFKLVGSALLAFASALLAGYVFFSKKSDKKTRRQGVNK